MIESFVHNLAAEIGISLSHISLVDGTPLGCCDACLLNMAKDKYEVSTLVYQSDIDKMQNGAEVDRLTIKVRSALLRLKLLFET